MKETPEERATAFARGLLAHGPVWLFGAVPLADSKNLARQFLKAQRRIGVLEAALLRAGK